MCKWFWFYRKVNAPDTYTTYDMAKIVVEELDCCHKFVESTVRYILPITEQKFVHITHLVGADVLFIFCVV